MSYCNWENTSELNIKYHDEEWGVPLHNDKGQFEFLMMEVMQCGLNWNMMINKREIFRRCFDNFDFDKVAAYTDEDVDRIMNTDGMIKSPRKINAVVQNAKAFTKIVKEFGSFSAYLWGWSDGKTILYDRHNEGYIPVSNGLSYNISRDLKKRGFKYIGAITMYSHLQACGIINDHAKDCPRYDYINSYYPVERKPCDDEKEVGYFGD